MSAMSDSTLFAAYLSGLVDSRERVIPFSVTIIGIFSRITDPPPICSVHLIQTVIFALFQRGFFFLSSI